jgi:hypothetical protein
VRTSYLLILLGGLVITGSGIYAMMSDSATLPKAESTLKAVVAPIAGELATDDIAALRAENSRMAAEVNTVRAALGDIDALQRELRQLKEEVAALRASGVSVAVPGPASAMAGAAGDLPLTREDMEVLAEEQDYKNDQRRQKVSAIYRAEPVDASWSNETTDLIMEAFDKTDPEGSTLASVDCRSSLCRVEVDGGAVGPGLRLSREVHKALPRMIYFHEPSQDGTRSTVIYMVREGYDSPTTL